MALREKLDALVELRSRWAVPQSPVDLVIRRIHASWCNTAIEGNSLPWSRALSLARDEFLATDRQDREMLSSLKAAEFLDTAPEDWNLAMVRHLHALVMEGLAARPGELREREVKIVKESGKGAGETVFHPPHPARVRELLDSLLVSCNAAEEDPFLHAGRFHYEFQSIHPFEDGNGRVGRLLTTILARRGWTSTGFHLEPAIRRAGPGYYLALRAVRADYENDGPAGLYPWLLPFLDMVADAFAHPETPEIEI